MRERAHERLVGARRDRTLCPQRLARDHLRATAPVQGNLAQPIRAQVVVARVARVDLVEEHERIEVRQFRRLA